jgi:hypothetical protein
VLRAAPCFLAASLVVVSLGGCKKDSKSQTSSGLFIAPIQEPSAEPIAVHADKLDFLRLVDPRLDSELALLRTVPSVMGRLSERTVIGVDAAQQEIDEVTETDQLLVSEGNTDGVFSVDLCRDASAPECGLVKLHYDSRGLDAEADGTQSISASVTPIKLQNGWIVAFDPTDKNIVAFRAEAPRQVEGPDGTSVAVPYRGGPREDNVGLGNGVVVSVVVRGADMMDQLNAPAEPVVTRLFELENNKLLVFFSTTQNVHLLELTEEEKLTDFDLADRGNRDTQFNVKFLRGTFRLFGSPAATRPFLASATIGFVTQVPELKMDTFQPLQVPDTSDGVAPPVGRAFVFDQASSSFLLMSVRRGVGDDIVGGQVTAAISTATVKSVLQPGAGATIDAFEMSGGFDNAVHPTELLFFERKTKNILAYNYALDPAAQNNLRIFIGASSVLVRRTAQGGLSTTTSTEPDLVFATDDVRDNRLAFDQELDQVVSMSYTSGVLVIVADKDEIALATGDVLSDFTYMEPLDATSLRAFDSQTTSLVEIRLQYAAFPLTIR